MSNETKLSDHGLTSNQKADRDGLSGSALQGWQPIETAPTDGGMTPYGPSHPDYPNAPSDWDGGPYMCRDGGLYHMRGYGWAHGLGCWNPAADWDRVAYTAKAIPHTPRGVSA